MTMHEVVHKMVVGECHKPNFEGLGSAWMAYMNARIAGLFLLVLLDYPNGKGVVRAMSRDSIWHYIGWMAGPYRVEEATRSRNLALIPLVTGLSFRPRVASSTR
ncbi:hypothetical protein Tco_1349032 [Tanacetum coccineum]